MKMLEQERGIKPVQYASDIIWPSLALRKLAGERLKVSREELVKEYQTRYGPAVRARLIACTDPTKARQLRKAAAADPDNFGNLAKDHSEDPSASLKGMIQPIRRHGSYQQIEQAAFNMADGEVSQVIPVAGQYVILKKEGTVGGVRTVSFEQALPQLEEIVRDRKMRKVSKDVFRRLQARCKVVNVLNDPARGRTMPGVVAVINGQRITRRELSEQCIQRHGREVLDGMVNRKLLEQECKKRRITITEADLDAEIARAAAESVDSKPDGSPDVEAWLKLVTDKQGGSVEVYRRDSVWPSVALTKLVGDKVRIADADLQKGYDANYGQRVRCRAILMDNLRRAQQVWEKARDNPTVENFGELAAQYSVEGPSRALRGEVPPIKRHGGQPLLEKEAFSLKPGELSGVVQVGPELFAILFCEGYTEPTGVEFETVRDYIYRDVFEKKQRLAMAAEFRRLQEAATIDNYLAGTTQSPKKKTAGPRPAVHVPQLRQVPGR